MRRRKNRTENNCRDMYGCLMSERQEKTRENGEAVLKEYLYFSGH